MSGTKLPEVHGVQKELDPNLRPEKQHSISKQGKFEMLQMGQGRAGSMRRNPDPINQAINQPSDVTQGIQRGTRIVTGKTNSTQGTNSMHDRLINNNNPLMLDVILHPDPLLKSPKQQNTHETSHNPNVNLDFEKIHHFRKVSCLRHSKDWTSNFFPNPKDLRDLINKENSIHKALPKQTDIDKILEVIQRKVLKGTHLPVEVKEIQAEYLHSPYFKDLYQYLLQNKLPSSKPAIQKLEALSEKYVLLDLLLFRINPEKETAVLVVPESCTDKIITLYHKSLFAGHQFVIKTYLTISDKFLSLI